MDGLEKLSIRVSEETRLPDPVACFLAEARRRERLVVETLGCRALGFVSSDFELLYPVLEALHAYGAAETFCEWGSGLGVAAGMAAWIGYRATGVEIQPLLVAESIRLLRDFDLDVDILEGSFLPEDFTVHPACQLEEPVTVISGAGAVDDVDIEIADFDVIYAFPWPGEEEMYFSLFERRASTGALLVTYHGEHEGILVQRKT